MKDRISFLTLALAKGKGGGAKTWLGVTTTPLVDGDDTNPIDVDGKSVTAVAGDTVQYETGQFTFSGEVWQSIEPTVEVDGKKLIFN